MSEVQASLAGDTQISKLQSEHSSAELSVQLAATRSEVETMNERHADALAQVAAGAQP